MRSILQDTDDIRLPSTMDLALAVLMMLSGLVFSQRYACNFLARVKCLDSLFN